ncbi:hypothetical protein [Lysobacter sp. Root690]|uniref:hypothetical protein n=1 Tax=Lysobacter sp. Root690 TaxID=1736588 RepID=UPI0006FF6E11|nr:hypothetical protein [Lysobacter sp. Root690]KRB11517.1 hypothetical protein ASD86_03685 [Lysobacter sp. Root690]
MQGIKLWAVGALIAVLGLAHSQPARAGDMSNAVVTCFVDTYALDVPEAFSCTSVWRPGGATNPTTALFQVAGLGAGNYSYAWRDLETNTVPAGCGNQPYCEKSISTETQGDGEATLRVTITDLDTGATKNVQATAFYYDGYT